MPWVNASASLRAATVVLDDRAILRDVSLEVAPGITVIRGANGAGKTTLLRAIAGLVPLARGERAVSNAPLYLGHRAMLLRGLTAVENLEFFARFRGQASTTVSDTLARWGLGGDLDRPVDRLSEGQRRRASLARLDTETVPIALLDEPFGDLDEEAAALLRAAIARARDAGRAIVIATHGHAELDAEARQRLRLADAMLQPA